MTTLLLAGCHTFEPPVGGAAPEGTVVRLTLSDSGSTALASYLGPGVTSVTGRLRADTAIGNYSLAVREVELRGGSSKEWQGDAVAVPRQYVANVRVSRLSVPRTALLSTAIVAATVVVVRSLAGSAGGSGAPINGGGGGRAAVVSPHR